MTHLSTLRCLVSALLVLWAGTTVAQSRVVIINGKLLSDANLAELSRRHCADIPDGSYWLDTRSGAWGYAGNPQVQGYLGDPCRAGAGGVNQDGTYGPYATRRRAEEVANGFRSRGLQAVWFHNGDGFYVRVKR